MNAERWVEVCRLFDAASGMPAPERAAFLEKECGKDADLRSEVETLLARDEGESFLDEPRTGGLAAGRRVGPYELAGELGRGGMGIVYEAVRRDQGFDRAVALKLVKRGMDTDFILRRFESERRILGELDHPNIARVLDGGETSDGLPFFVMELIRGQDLLEYCDEKKLGTAERLALFRQVCAAVTYAHQRLVIHRDIKPANILVTEEGVPKLLDFGIAKLLSGEDGGSSRTETALRVLTPEYASPEQVLGRELTTSSDVYSLGVVLYELLTGQRPYKLTTRAPEEISAAIVGQEPAKPSTKTRLHRDLDDIVMMALRKEPERRYASAEQLSEDIRRHLEGLPVRATPDSVGYRAGKFIRRHKAGVAAIALAAASLVVGLGAALWQVRVAQRERSRAEAHLSDVRRLSTSFLFEHHDAIKNLAGSTPARKLLVERGVKYLDLLSKEAAGDPEFQRELAEAYQRLGNLQGGMGNEGYLGQSEAALASYRKSLALREALPSKDPKSRTDLAQIHIDTGHLILKMGKMSEALAHYRTAVSIRERLVGESPDDTGMMNDLGVAYHFLASGLYETGDEKGQIEAYRREASLFERVAALKPGDRKARRNLGLVYQYLGGEFSKSSLLLPPQPDEDLSAAAETLGKARALQEALCAEDPGNATYRKDLSSTYAELGHTRHRSRDYSGAVEAFRAGLRIREELSAADPGDMRVRDLLGVIQIRLGYELTLVGAQEEGIALCRKALANTQAAAAADPKNVFLQAAVAKGLFILGLSLLEPGAAARGSGRVALSREARTTLVRSRDAFLSLRKAGHLPATYSEHFTDLTGLLDADEENRAAKKDS